MEYTVLASGLLFSSMRDALYLTVEYPHLMFVHFSVNYMPFIHNFFLPRTPFVSPCCVYVGVRIDDNNEAKQLRMPESL